MHGVSECEEEEEDEEMKAVHSAGLTLPLTQNSIVATSLAPLPSPTTPKFVFKPLPGTAKRYRIVKEARLAKLPPTVALTANLPRPTVLAKLVEVVDESLPLHAVGVKPPHPITPTSTFTEPTPTSATTTAPKPQPATRVWKSVRLGQPSMILTKGADLAFADMDAWIAALTERADCV
ncbi:hypothetical protein GGF32_009682 [Allomyces javanicus]|nr:hypothetical protein GGF32_009682 [Allomyces javanicus]